MPEVEENRFFLTLGIKMFVLQTLLTNFKKFLFTYFQCKVGNADFLLLGRAGAKTTVIKMLLGHFLKAEKLKEMCNQGGFLQFAVALESVVL